MTRVPGELLREVATALACFASTKHAQAWVQKNPAIKAEMLAEVDRIEALEREVRDAAQAQAERTYSLTDVNRAQWAIHMGHWHAARGGASKDVLDALLWSHARVIDVMDGNDPTDALPAMIARVDAALAQAQAGAAGEGQGEGA